MTDESVPEASITTTEPAPAVAPPTSVMAELKMRPEDMFPESPPGQGDMRNLSQRDPVDRRPPWLYRLTEELTGPEVRKLFIPTPHETVQRLLRFIEKNVGEDRERALHVPGVPVVRPKPRTALVWRVLDRVAHTLGYVPASMAEYAAACERAEGQRVGAWERLQGRVDFALDLHARAREILSGIFPHLEAETREGKNFRGRRTIAVWADPENPVPNEEPEW